MLQVQEIVLFSFSRQPCRERHRRDGEHGAGRQEGEGRFRHHRVEERHRRTVDVEQRRRRPQLSPGSPAAAVVACHRLAAALLR